MQVEPGGQLEGRDEGNVHQELRDDQRPHQSAWGGLAGQGLCRATVPHCREGEGPVKGAGLVKGEG